MHWCNDKFDVPKAIVVFLYIPSVKIVIDVVYASIVAIAFKMVRTSHLLLFMQQAFILYFSIGALYWIFAWGIYSAIYSFKYL